MVFIQNLKKPALNKFLALNIFFWTPYIFFSFVATKMPAYPLIAAPAVFIMTAAFIDNLNSYLLQRKIIVMRTAFVIAFFLLPVIYCNSRIKFFQYDKSYRSYISEIKELNKTYHEDKVILFNFKHPIEAMFFTNFTAVYSYTPAISVLDDLHKKGFTLLINQNRNIKDTIEQSDYIQIVTIHEDL